MSEVQPERKANIVPMTATMETSDKEITIRINRRIANIFVAACAAILLFIVFNSPIPGSAGIEQRSSVRELLMGKLEPEVHSLPVESPKTESPKTKTIVKHITVYKMPEVKEPEQPTAESALPEVVVNEPVAVETSVAPKAPAPKAPVAEVTTKEEKTAPVVSEPVPQTPQYCIVMASAISKKNAENYAAKLREQGFNNPRVHATNKMVRVVIGNYSSESEAYNVAETMRRSSDEYGSIWVLKL
jgi:cell division septation protein DedD